MTYSCLKQGEPNTTNQNDHIENRQSGFCTADAQTGCTYAFHTNVPLVVSGCTLTVSYKAVVCPVSGTNPFKKLQISDFEIDNIGTGVACQPIKFILTPPTNGNYQQWYQNSYNPFYKSLTLMVENLEIEKLAALNQISPCGAIFGTSTIDFIESGCYKVCRSNVLDEDGWAPLIDVKCGDGCCFRSTNFCKMPDGSIIRKDAAYVTASNKCDPISNICDGNENNLCQPACGKL